MAVFEVRFFHSFNKKSTRAYWWIVHQKAWTVLLFALSIGSLTGCSENTGNAGNDNGPVSRVEINISKFEFWLIDTLMLSAHSFS